MQQVAAMDDVRLALQGLPRPLDLDGRLEPRLEAEGQNLLAEPPDDVRNRRHARRDRVPGKDLGDDRVSNGDDLIVHFQLFRRPALEPADGQALGRDEPPRKIGSERPDEPGLVRGREPVGEGEDVGFVDSDPGRIPLLDDFGQPAPLIDLLRIPGGRVQLADPVAPDRQALDSVLAPVEKDEHGRPAGGVGVGRNQGQINRIFIVLGTDHEPHVDLFPAHDLGKNGFQAEAEPPVADRGPVLQAENRGDVPAGRRARPGEKGSRNDGQKNKKTNPRVFHATSSRTRPSGQGLRPLSAVGMFLSPFSQLKPAS